MDFDLAQTFFLDPDQVQGAQYIYITSVDLYFESKPVEGKTQSGLPKPGVSVYIAPTVDKVPELEKIHSVRSSYLPYDSIVTSIAGNTATRFTFVRPVICDTNALWSMLIRFDGSDNGYKLWYNQAGEFKLGTKELTTVSQGKVDGNFFKITNGKSLTPKTDADLTFKVNIAQFTSLSATWKYKNRPYEVIQSYTINGKFIGGEDVFQRRSVYSTGNVAVTKDSAIVIGTGTNFVSQLAGAGTRFVITDTTDGNTVVREVASIANAVYMTLTEPVPFTNATAKYYKTVVGNVYESDNDTDVLILDNSNANSTIILTTDDTVVGVDSGATANISAIEAFQLNSLIPNFHMFVPKETAYTSLLNVANSSYAVDTNNQVPVQMLEQADLDTYRALLASATIEQTTSPIFNSVSGSVTFTTTNKFTSPFVWEENLDMFGDRYSINNDTTNETIDGQGNAQSRYISKAIGLADGQVAEDVKVNVRAFRPINTDIKMYARFKAPDATIFSSWTEMTSPDPIAKYSNQINKTDFIDLTFEMPFSPVGTLQSGTFTSQSGNNIITGTSGTVNTNIAVGDVVRVYFPAVANTYLVDTVIASNTTTITLSRAISNGSLTTSGLLVDKVDTPEGAFLDVQNSNILTYLGPTTVRGSSTTRSRNVGYNSYQFKAVLLSSDGILVPYLADIRAIAVSA